MAIYHLEAKVISRGTGRSAVAAAAYMSCSAMLNDYDGIQHDYTRKQGLVWEQVFLPEHAPAEWADRVVLWNAVEESEKTKDSRLAREFVVALPVELEQEEWKSLLTEFIQEQFVSDGMCADVAIHNTDGHNPHAHIMLTVRPLDGQGKWQYKTEKEYLCVRNGEERGFTSDEFKAAQHEGWERQYPYKVGKKKVYMTPSAADAQGLERASKYPKSTKYGRQNPIAQRWNSEEQLALWREAWADAVNHSLERQGREERIDHRSHASRGLDEQPTIHEGVTARALERQGIVSDRCELNRQIKADNALLRELKAQVKKLIQAVQNTVPGLAEAMESLRAKMILFRYQLRRIDLGKLQRSGRLEPLKTKMTRYTALVQQIKQVGGQRKNLLAEKKSGSKLNLLKQRDLSRWIAELTEDLEELRSEKAVLLQELQCADEAEISDIKKDIATLENDLKKLEQMEKKYTAELDDALVQYGSLRAQTAAVDLVELMKARIALRPEKEQNAVQRLQRAYDEKFDPSALQKSREDVAVLLDEQGEMSSVREKLREKSDKAKPWVPKKKKQMSHEMER
jgi:ATP-dependent exoDNAse (exonuclease V) alpha subunit